MFLFFPQRIYFGRAVTQKKKKSTALSSFSPTLHLSLSALHLHPLLLFEAQSLTAALPFDKLLGDFCMTKHTGNSSHVGKKGQSFCQGALKSRAVQQQINVLIKGGS